MKIKLSIFLVLLASVALVGALNKEKDCKCRMNSFQRIVGGRLGTQGSHPWYANIEFSIYKNITSNLCAATILNHFTLLTAASCVPIKRIPKDLLEKFNIVIKGSKEIFKIEEIFIHPDYKQIGIHNATNDLALVKLEKKIEFTKLVQPACLSFENRETYNGALNVAGFGHQQSYQVIGPYIIHFDPFMKFNFTETEVYDRTQQLCPQNKKTQICVHNEDKKGVCIGDLGSGLHLTEAGRTKIIGVNSQVFKEDIDKELYQICSTGHSAMRLSAYKQFIAGTLGEENICS